MNLVRYQPPYHHLLFLNIFLLNLLISSSQQQNQLLLSKHKLAGQEDEATTAPHSSYNRFQPTATTSGGRSRPPSSEDPWRAPAAASGFSTLSSIGAPVQSRRPDGSRYLSRQYDTLPATTNLQNPLTSTNTNLAKQQPNEPPGDEQLNKYKLKKRDSELKPLRIEFPTEASSVIDDDTTITNQKSTSSQDICSDRLCYGLPKKCLDDRRSTHLVDKSRVPSLSTGGSMCTVLVTSKQLIDPFRPATRDIHFELVALPVEGRSNYAAVGFSDSGRMSGLVSECLQYRDTNTQLQVIKLAHSYNIPLAYTNVPATILSGIKNLGVSYENGYYQCRWVVESAVDFSYEDPSNATVIVKREDLGYKNYHILLAAGEYDEQNQIKLIHSERVGSMTPVSLAQIGHIKSLGAHILIRIHGSLMIVIWIGLVTISVMLARYYKNEWLNSKINDLAIWFVVHRAFMLIAWFGSIISVIFAYMYTETYHPGLHQISGTTCIVLSTIQVLGGLFRPSAESSKRTYFNWTHFICGNLSYLFAMISIVTAAFLAPAHLLPLYIWVVVAFVAFYALTHFMMTIHQYIVHRSSKISITPMSDLHDTNSSATFSSCGFVADTYPKEGNSTFRQLMLGIIITVVAIFIVLLISLVNMK